MKAKTERLAIEWLKSAKSSDKFMINTKPHSKKEIEKMLGLNDVHIDIKVEEHADMGQEEDHGDSE